MIEKKYVGRLLAWIRVNDFSFVIHFFMSNVKNNITIRAPKS